MEIQQWHLETQARPQIQVHEIFTTRIKKQKSEYSERIHETFKISRLERATSRNSETNTNENLQRT